MTYVLMEVKTKSSLDSPTNARRIVQNGWFIITVSSLVSMSEHFFSSSPPSCRSDLFMAMMPSNSLLMAMFTAMNKGRKGKEKEG